MAMGRPKKEIQRDQFEKLCGLQCTLEEICGWFDVSDKTLDKWCRSEYNQTFSEVFRKKRESGRISLRRSQFRLAEKSAAMAIWLGKQYLGQKERVVVSDENEGRLADLISGLMEVGENDLHAEAVRPDEDLAEGAAEEA